jgi:hypothetical protein
MVKFDEAVSATPDSTDVLTTYGNTLRDYALQQPLSDSAFYFSLALSNYSLAYNSEAIFKLVTLIENMLQLEDLANWSIRIKLEDILLGNALLVKSK